MKRSRSTARGAIIALGLCSPLMGCGGSDDTPAPSDVGAGGAAAAGSAGAGGGHAGKGTGGTAGAAGHAGTAAGGAAGHAGTTAAAGHAGTSGAGGAAGHAGTTGTGGGGASGKGGSAGHSGNGGTTGGNGGTTGGNGGNAGSSTAGNAGTAGSAGMGAGGVAGTGGASGSAGSAGAPAKCGDGVKNGAEYCDETDLGGSSCFKALGKPAQGTLTCKSDCTFDTSACVFCGDGVKNGSEYCDGAALGTASCDSVVGTGSVGVLGCRSDCTYDTNACSQLPTCGDGVKNAADLCDGSDFGGATCVSLLGASAAGVPSCTAQCTIDTSSCTVCGNQKKDGADECDGADLGGASCTSVAGVPASGALSCTATCTLDKSACLYCGDGARNGSEACEGTDFGGATCASIVGAGSNGTLACVGCVIDSSACSPPPACGDGTKNGTDQCDTADLGGADCTSATGFPATGTLACNSNCSFDVTACAYCGDGVKNGGDACDGSDLGAATCSSVLGKPFGGSPTCNSACQIDTSGCTPVALHESRGSAVAISDDDSVAVVVNRDAGSVTVLSLDHTASPSTSTLVAELQTGAGSEPWQVVISPSGTVGYVVLRRDQRVVRIDNLKTPAPTLGLAIAVGSEPTSLALTPSGATLYVANWGEGTVTVVDTGSMSPKSSVDLNATIAGTGLLGAVTSRPSLAHPRSIAVTNNGDNVDSDETIVVTEFFAQRIAPEDSATKGKKSDTSFAGLLYTMPVATLAAKVVQLPPVADTKFNNRNGAVTGCFPNQLESVSLHDGRAYVTSVCESPVGPIGPFTGPALPPLCATDADCPGAVSGSCAAGKCSILCTTNADCFGGLAGACFAGKCTSNCGADANCPGAGAGSCNTTNFSCKTNCSTAADCGSNGGVCNANVCATNTVDAKTTTHPGLSVVDLTAGTATTVNLDANFDAYYVANAFVDNTTRRMPLVPTDVGFGSGSTAYVSANGADALFRVDFDANGAIASVGSSTTNAFVNLNIGATPGQGPIGVANGNSHAIALVASDITRNAALVETVTDTLTASVTQTSPLPMVGSAADDIRLGKRFFNTGLARWSLKGQGWGACQVCHVDGLADNVTWYFARGPRQSISLDGTFASLDPTDQRILNWGGIFDEVADFEGNVRGVSGGVGAIVSTVSNPLAVTDRIDPTAVSFGGTILKEDGLNGSDFAIGVAPGATGQDAPSKLTDWAKMTKYVQSIRSPRRPTTLIPADVAAGLAIFQDPLQGNCVGCHSGAKWTVSKVFYTPEATDTVSKKLFSTDWGTAATASGFPPALFPSSDAPLQTDRGPVPGNGAFDQLVCTLRPVGTIKAVAGVVTGVSPPEVNVQEVRQDHATPGQGAGVKGVSGPNGAGFNMPSVLNMQAGAPYFHAGNARTLEEAFSATFAGHYGTPVAPGFVPTPDQVRQIVAYLLTIDETQAPFGIPTTGATGGDICVAP